MNVCKVKKKYILFVSRQFAEKKLKIFDIDKRIQIDGEGKSLICIYKLDEYDVFTYLLPEVTTIISCDENIFLDEDIGSFSLDLFLIFNASDKGIRDLSIPFFFVIENYNQQPIAYEKKANRQLYDCILLVINDLVLKLMAQFSSYRFISFQNAITVIFTLIDYIDDLEFGKVASSLAYNFQINNSGSKDDLLALSSKTNYSNMSSNDKIININKYSYKFILFDMKMSNFLDDSIFLYDTFKNLK